MVACVIALALTGCGPSHDQFIHFLRSRENVVSSGDYRVAPPDAITVHAPVAPEIDGRTYQVRPDGKVALRLLGEVQVAGLTTQEVADKMTKLLARYYIDPEVVVDVGRYRSKFYYIFGEVGVPGAKPYTGRDTLLKALADARPNVFAWRSRIRITRPNADEAERATIIVDLDQMLRTGETNQDVLLQEGDIIEVPPTPLAWVGHQVRAVMYPISPVLNAYNTPADFMDSTDEYEGNDDHYDRD
ncbi:MAG: polysaccharide export protein [Phycisphaerae bacterium]|nr:polysaccharide export protein [Phycisphaerae bacterium]